MTSNDPSRRASVASTTSDTSLLEQTNGPKLAAKKEKPNGSVKLKKVIAKNTKPKDGEGSEPKTRANSPSPDPGSPINEADLGKPIEDKPDHIQCKHCKKPTPKAVAQSHVKLCEQKKKEKARKKKEAKELKAAQAKEKERAEREKAAEEAGDDANAATKPSEEVGEASAAGESNTKIAKKSAGKAATDGPKTTKKRKADADGDKEPKKKKLKKDEPPKPKLPKPKGPVDVEKQCGVLLPNGGYCARSLTCKSHSMGAKRAVPGRSLPYDILLASYQKKNQAKQQKAALSSLAPGPEDLEPTGPVDSDEETEAVMAGIRRSRPQPIAQHYHIDIRRRYEVIRRKECLRQALSGPNGHRLFAVGPQTNDVKAQSSVNGISGSMGINTQAAAAAAAAGSSGGTGNDDADAPGSAIEWADGAADGIPAPPMRKASIASTAGGQKGGGGGQSRKTSVAV